MDEKKLRQLFKNRADAYLNTIDESVEQGMSEDCFIKTLKEAITVIQCSKLLPDKLKPVLARIEQINSLGKSGWWEVVYYDGNWQSYRGSNTFENGEKVVDWEYCEAIV